MGNWPSEKIKSAITSHRMTTAQLHRTYGKVIQYSVNEMQPRANRYLACVRVSVYVCVCVCVCVCLCCAKELASHVIQERGMQLALSVEWC